MNKKIAAVLAASCMWFGGGVLIAADVKPAEVPKPAATAAVAPTKPAEASKTAATVAAVAPAVSPAADGAAKAPQPTGKIDVVALPKIDPEKPPVMAVKVEPWKPTEPAKDAKPVGMLLLNKGAGHDDWIIKKVSVCDQNNIWCVVNDGTKDGIYQLTSKGLEHRFDGVFVAAGKGIVAAINAQNEVFELEGGTGTNWKKVEGFKLTKISRPSHNVGRGLLDVGKGSTTFFSYDDDTNKWSVVKNALGQPAKGIVDCSVNAEDVALALNDKGELLKSDLQRMQLYVKAQVAMNTPKKSPEGRGGGGKKGAGGKKGGKQHRGKKAHGASKKGGVGHGKKVPPKKHAG